MNKNEQRSAQKDILARDSLRACHNVALLKAAEINISWHKITANNTKHASKVDKATGSWLDKHSVFTLRSCGI